jgi:hypothetical protein
MLRFLLHHDQRIVIAMSIYESGGRPAHEKARGFNPRALLVLVIGA